jgi:hypothetical protein
MRYSRISCRSRIYMWIKSNICPYWQLNDGACNHSYSPKTPMHEIYRPIKAHNYFWERSLLHAWGCMHLYISSMHLCRLHARMSSDCIAAIARWDLYQRKIIRSKIRRVSYSIQAQIYIKINWCMHGCALHIRHCCTANVLSTKALHAAFSYTSSFRRGQTDDLFGTIDN